MYLKKKKKSHSLFNTRCQRIVQRFCKSEKVIRIKIHLLGFKDR